MKSKYQTIHFEKDGYGYVIRSADGWHRGRIIPAKTTEGKRVWWVIRKGNDRDGLDNRIASSVSEAKRYAKETIKIHV